MLRATGIRGCVLAIVLATVPPAWAGAVTINPMTGWQGYFLWENGVGLIDGISEEPYYHEVDHDTWPRGDTEWSIAVAEDAVIPRIEVWDNYDVPGDIYDLLLDGVVMPASSTVDGPGTYFYWQYDNVPLTEGTHVFTINVTATGGKYIHYGSGHIDFDMTGSAIPAPAAILLGALGTSLVGRLRARRTL